jgi:hypothetical protein
MTENKKEGLAQIESQLRQLNQQFPAERSKPYEKRDPEYRAQQAELTKLRLLLRYTQNVTKLRLKGGDNDDSGKIS